MNITSLELYALQTSDAVAPAGAAADFIMEDVYRFSRIGMNKEFLDLLGHPFSKPAIDLVARPIVQRGLAGLLCSIAHYLLWSAGMQASEKTTALTMFIAQRFSSDFNFQQSFTALSSAIQDNENLYSLDDELFVLRAGGRFVEGVCSHTAAFDDFACTVGFILTGQPMLMRIDLGIAAPKAQG